MSIIHLYFRIKPQKDRFIPGDRYLISLLRKLIRPKKVSGLERVFINLCSGFDELKVKYDTNLPFKKIKPGEPVIVLGHGHYALQGYDRPNAIIAGIGLMTHPASWPNLCTEYPVVKYLQHSEWTKNVYVPYYGADKCDLWPAGIDTDKWAPVEKIEKKYDLLIYNKIMWNKEETNAGLKMPIMQLLDAQGLTYQEIMYGQYQENEYRSLLQQCKAMLFLCEHESQGFACCEAMAMNVPVFAWDQGWWLDPHRFEWNDPVVPATSVPFFNETCGMSFKDLQAFEANFSLFWQKVAAAAFEPRKYILENLTLKKSAERMLAIVHEIYPG